MTKPAKARRASKSEGPPAAVPPPPSPDPSKTAPSTAVTLRGKLQKIEMVQKAEDGQKLRVALTFRGTVGEGRDLSLTPAPAGFDPWTSTEPEIAAWIRDGAIGPQHPAMAQWASAQHVTRNRSNIESSGAALLEAVAHIARQGLVMPKWMADTYIGRFLKIQRLEVGSLDEAFGFKATTQKRLAAKKRQKDQLPELERRLVRKIQENPDRPIERALFEEVGSELGMSGGAVEAAYYEGIRAGHLQDLRHLKALGLRPEDWGFPAK